MQSTAKVSGQSYYDLMPPASLAVGDIWSGLPAFGHLRRESCGGIVITPACDLSNRKAETVTYLPVISVEDYLVSRAFSPEMVRVVKGQMGPAGLDLADGWQIKGVDLPELPIIRAALGDAKKVLASGAGEKAKIAAGRVVSAARVLLGARGVIQYVGAAEVRIALGDKEYVRCMSEICRNAYSSDIHFLPCDGRVGVHSAMERHSLVLFRYPMALPVELLHAANDVAVVDWESAVAQLGSEFPVVINAIRTRPMRVAMLRSRFLPDLLSRFAALHIRMGSPDFTPETIESFVQDLGDFR